MKHTYIKIDNLATVTSGIYLDIIPDGEVAYLHINDFFNTEPLRIASKVAMSPRVMNNLLHKGDILFTSKGFVYFAKKYNMDAPAVASTAFFVIRILNKEIIPEYLCWFLNQQTAKAYFKTQRQGTGVPVIRKDVVLNLKIPIPDLDIQKKIVEFSRLAEKEYELRKKIASKEKNLIDQILMKTIK